MSGTLALVRASWGTARSYRLGMAVSLATVLFQLVPMYYVGHTLQGFMADRIRGEGHDYFSFMVVGTVTYLFVSAAVDSLPRAIEKGLSTGTIEALFATPAPIRALVVGLSGYDLLWAGARALLILAGAALVSAPVTWASLPAVMVVLFLLVVAYFGIGLIAAGLVLAFRRTGPLQTVAIVGSALLAGVSYPTSLIPPGIRVLTPWVPMTYALRAVRRLLVNGAPLRDVAADGAMLGAFALAGIVIGTLVFAAGLRYARRTGTLGQY